MKAWKMKFYLVASVVAIFGLYLGGWYFERWMRYKFSNETFVRGTVREMVLPGCLKD